MFEQYNRRQETQFTSTGEKILAHPELVRSLRERRMGHPVVLHIMPTERCNLKCEFCSVAHREALPDLPFELITDVIEKLCKYGLKAIILSGGGDPTLYAGINRLLSFAYDKGLEVGMITNGILLTDRVDGDHISRMSWIRISLNTLDYLEDFKMPDFSGVDTTLGFSYIWNPKSDIGWPRVEKKIKEIQGCYPVAYVRLLPDCNLREQALEKKHAFLREMAGRLGPPFFHQYKTHKTPKECHLGRIHPVLYTDRMIYPCDSLVLNSPATDKKFHSQYAVCAAQDIDSFYKKRIDGSLINTQKYCPCCVFYRQNMTLMDLLYASKAPKIVESDTFEHVNFV